MVNTMLRGGSIGTSYILILNHTYMSMRISSVMMNRVYSK